MRKQRRVGVQICARSVKVEDGKVCVDGRAGLGKCQGELVNMADELGDGGAGGVLPRVRGGQEEGCPVEQEAVVEG